MPRKSVTEVLSRWIRFSAGYGAANDRGDPCSASRSAETHRQLRQTFTVRDRTGEAWWVTTAVEWASSRPRRGPLAIHSCRACCLSSNSPMHISAVVHLPYQCAVDLGSAIFGKSIPPIVPVWLFVHSMLPS